MIFHTKLLCVPLHVRFNKTDEFIKIYNGTRYLVLFGPERYDAIYDRTRYISYKWKKCYYI